MNHIQPLGQTKRTHKWMVNAAAVALIVGVLISWWMVDQARAQPVGGGGGDRPALFLGNDSLPPMNFMKNGKPTGIVIDLAEALAERMHHPVEIKLMNWTEAQQLVLEGRADALLQIDPNPERLKIYDFSEPLLSTEFTLFTSVGRFGIASMRDLHGLKVGVEEKGLPILLLQEDPQIFVEIIPDFVQGFRLLATGTLDAVFADRWVGRYVLAENDIQGVKLFDVPIIRSHSAIAVKKGNTKLLGDINAALADIRRDGTYDRIIRSWRSKEVVFKTREQLRQQAWLLAAISVVLITALLGLAALVREIRRRKRVESALREIEEQLRLFIEHAPASLAMFDRNMHYLSASRRWLKDYNLEDRDLTGLSHYEVFPEIGEQWKAVHRRAVAGEVVQADNDRFERADGSVQWLRWEVRPWHVATGEVGGIAVFTEDTTARKLAEEALRESESRFRTLFESIVEGVALHELVYDAKGIVVDYRIISTNPAFEKHTGLKPEQVEGQLASSIYGTGVPPYLEEYARVAKSGQTFSFETFFPPMGRHFSISVTSPARDRFTTVFEDITERKQAEAALRESEERFRLFMDHSPTIAWMKDEQGRHVYLSKNYEERLAVRLEDWHGKTDAELWPASTAEEFGMNDLAVLAADHPIEVIEETLNPDGSRCCWLSSKFPFRDTAGNRFVAGIALDITERRRAEEALRESERRFRALAEALPQIVWTADAEGRVEWFNQRWYDYTGEPLGIGEGWSWDKVTHPDDMARTLKNWQEARQRGDLFQNEIRVRRHDGRYRWFLVRAWPLRNADGNAVRWFGTNTDIHDMKAAESALRQSREDLDRAQAVGQIGSWRLDVSRNVLTWSDENHRIFGVPKGIPLTYESFLGIVHAADRQYVDTQWKAGLRGEPYDIEHRIVAGGQVKWVREKAFLEFDDAGALLGGFGITQDITERKRMEEELRRAHDELELRVRERTAELSATIARLELINLELQEFAYVASHDLQEPLRKIQTFCDMAKKRCAPVLDSTSQEYLDRVFGSAVRMRQLLRDLLEFSRVATLAQPFRKVDLGLLAREAADVFEVTVTETGCQIQIEDLPAIEADASHMVRLFQNLIGNGLKFRGGETPHIKVYGNLDGHGVCEIFVQDNGIGFEQQYAELIFKPFQRLHRRNEYDGTGIGLAICRKIVERHGGNIRAESEPGKGSTFIIRLPVRQINWENTVSVGQSS
jgi:PAS domain S-box-containing protein